MVLHSLFSGARSPREDTAWLLEATEQLSYGPRADRLRDDLMQLGVKAAPALRKRLLAGELPPAALEVFAAVACLCHPKDYNAQPCRAVALSLAVSVACPQPLPARFTDEEIKQSRDNELACYVGLAGLLRQARTSHALGAREREVALAAQCVLSLCSGAQFHSELRHHRSLLSTAEDVDPFWAAPRAAFDVLGAGSSQALDELGALADQQPGSPSLLWLDEFVCRLAGRDARADQQAQRLDSLLASGLGPNARSHAAPMLEMSRRGLVSDADQPRRAWARLAELRSAAASEPPEPDEEGGTPSLDEAIEVLRLRARQGDEQASLWLRICEVLGDEVKHVEQAASFTGPFNPTLPLTGEMCQALDGATHYLIMTFRLLRGLELLSPCAQRLARSLSAASD